VDRAELCRYSAAVNPARRDDPIDKSARPVFGQSLQVASSALGVV